MSNQSEFNAILDKLAEDYAKLNDKQITYAIKEVGRVRADIAELLTEFAADDGMIKRQRLSRLLRELDAIEKSLRANGTLAITSIAEESSIFAINGFNAAAMTVIGAPMVSSNIEQINKNVIDYVIRRFREDGLTLSDRVWTTSGEIRDSIASTLRSGIIRGESVSTIVRDIRKVYDTETWKIKRLVVTEGNTAYRVASANSVKASEVSDYVKINENGRRHGNHTNHKCYKLAQENRYGLGKGVFKPTDSEIYVPHPNCSSYLTAVLKDEYL